MAPDWLWIVFALSSALTTALYRVVTRHLMKRHSPYAFALLINVFGIFLTLPLAWNDFTWSAFPHAWWPWLLVATSTGLWCAIMIIVFTTYKHLPVSRREQISQVEVLFVLVLGVLLLHETVTWTNGLGAALVVIGASIAASGSSAIYAGWKSRGVQLTVFVALLYALVAIVDKDAQNYFPAGLYSFLLYLLPALVLLAFIGMKGNAHKTKLLVEHKGWIVIGATFLSVASYYLGLRTYDLVSATIAYPIFKLSTVFAVAFGLFFFREERVQVPRKLIAVALVMLGAILVAGGSLW